MEEKMDEKDFFKFLFLQLVYTFQHSAMIQLGKLVNPMTSKLERNLDQAKGTIEMLRMLKEKTKNNLIKEEQDFLDNIILDLQLNYADEMKKGDTKTESKETEKKDGKPGDK